jgi:transcriptional regulator with XRE-family HTH domain
MKSSAKSENSDRRKPAISRADIAERLRAFRSENHLEQAEVAAKLGIRQSGISDIERRQQKLTDHQLAILHLEYGLNLAWLLVGEPPMMNKDRSEVSLRVAAPTAPEYNPKKEAPAQIAAALLDAVRLVEQGKVSITITISPVSQAKG